MQVVSRRSSIIDCIPGFALHIPETIGETLPFTKVLSACHFPWDGMLDFHSFFKDKSVSFGNNLIDLAHKDAKSSTI
jgi:hypothetical protein